MLHTCINTQFKADYAAVGQLRGYLENLVCNEVVAIDEGVEHADLDRGILENRLNFSIGFGRWFHLPRSHYS